MIADRGQDLITMTKTQDQSKEKKMKVKFKCECVVDYGNAKTVIMIPQVGADPAFQEVHPNAKIEFTLASSSEEFIPGQVYSVEILKAT